ncbi:hypothetical protein BGZ58_005159 [Dissophora ornata]|nr:hypothetical protein BGZ58_005159 [Dissophora ornata]
MADLRAVLDELKLDENACRKILETANSTAAYNDTARTLATVLKPQKPPPYTGTIDAVAALNFIDGQEEYFEIVELVADKWVKYVVLSLHDDAKAWWRDSGLTISASWKDFKTAFLEAFTPPDAANTARRELSKLRQNSLSIAEYTTKFRRQLRLIPTMDADSALFTYLQGLEPETGKEVKLRQPTNLTTAIHQATIVHSILHPFKPINPHSANLPTKAPTPTLEPMDIDNLNVFLANFKASAGGNGRQPLSKLTVATREYNYRNGLCHRCRKPGHVARNCGAERSFNHFETAGDKPKETKETQLPGKDKGEQ